MSGADQHTTRRIHSILTSLLKHQLGVSLGGVEASLKQWRAGDLGHFETHAEVVRHVERAQKLASRMQQTDPAEPGTALRDAFDAGLVSEEEFVEIVGVAPEQVEPSPPIEDAEAVVLPDKQEYVTQLLEIGPVLIHLDPRRPGVDVPEKFRDDPRLILRFGYELNNPPIPDMRVDGDGVFGTLTFSGQPYGCLLPWGAIFAVQSEADGEPMAWPDDLPDEVLSQLGVDSEHDSSESEPTSQPPKVEPAAPAAPAPQRTKRRPSHLKLVE